MSRCERGARAAFGEHAGAIYYVVSGVEYVVRTQWKVLNAQIAKTEG